MLLRRSKVLMVLVKEETEMSFRAALDAPMYVSNVLWVAEGKVRRGRWTWLDRAVVEEKGKSYFAVGCGLGLDHR